MAVDERFPRLEVSPAAPVPATVILPAYNEAAALPTVLAGLFAVLGGEEEGEVIVVDDGSTDDTSAIARGYPCRLLRHAHNRGKGAAVRTGLSAARGDFVIVMDADATYPASVVPQMIALAREYDIVRCTRQEGRANMPPLNRLGNHLFDCVLHTLYGLEGVDHLSGLYGLQRAALHTMDLTAERFDLEVEIGVKAHALGLRATSLPIHYGIRCGEKKLRVWRDGRFILWRVVTLALHERLAWEGSRRGAMDGSTRATGRPHLAPAIPLDRRGAVDGSTRATTRECLFEFEHEEELEQREQKVLL